MRVIYLVSCTAQKATESKPAKCLYTSERFVLSRQIVERCLEYHRHCDEGIWFILSSKHHLVAPEVILEPYNDYLGHKSRSERRTWADKVFGSLIEQTCWHGWRPEHVFLIVLASKLYWEFVDDKARAAGFKVYVPWLDERPAGLKGQWKVLEWQKNWLRDQLDRIQQGDFSFCKKWNEYDGTRY